LVGTPGKLAKLSCCSASSELSSSKGMGEDVRVVDVGSITPTGVVLWFCLFRPKKERLGVFCLKLSVLHDNAQGFYFFSNYNS
jgi:hypothetical protein